MSKEAKWAVLILLALLVGGCTFLTPNRAKLATERFTYQNGGWVATDAAHAEWLGLIETNAKDAWPPNPVATKGWTSLRNGAWAVTEDAYNQFATMDYAKWNPGMPPPATPVK